MSATKKSLANRLYSGEISYDFIGNRKRWYTFSAVLVAVCLLALALRGLNLSIDFTGGSEFTVPTQVTSQTIDEYRDAAASSGLPDLGDIKVNTIGDGQVRVQVRALSAEEINRMTDTLAQHAGVPTQEVTNNLIGPSWGQQITQQGLVALVVFLALVSLLIWAYFRNWKMAVAAVLALLHDLIITAGVYALLQFAFTPATLIGMLTILGYSLYDTVVVFDRVRELTADITHQPRTFSEATNRAINQVLIRSINTTIIGVLPVAALLFAGLFIVGTGPLKDVGLSLFVGMVAGAYSSIFLAAPLYAQLREREPDMAAHRARLERRAAKRSGGSDDVVTSPDVGEDGVVATAVQGGATVDPARLGAVTPDTLERNQPRRTTRGERRKEH